MKPMLLERECPDTSKIPYPVMVSPKLDGIRCLIVNGEVLTRTLKQVPNHYIRSVLAPHIKQMGGFDGELIVGTETAADVYRTTNSHVMSHDKANFNFRYRVFDLWNTTMDYSDRLAAVKYRIKQLGLAFLKEVPAYFVQDEDELKRTEEDYTTAGYEGVVLRYAHSKYKFGRTTLKELNSLKLKRFEDSEAVILDVIEEQHNGNVAEENELGRTKRSTKAAGLTGKGSMGSLLVQDKITGVIFNIGSGFNADERQKYWDRRSVIKGTIIKYKFFPVGVKEKPRHPIYLGQRSTLDM